MITIESKNNYEYLLFKILNPRSGKPCSCGAARSVFVKELEGRALGSKKSELMNYSSPSDFTGRTRWVYRSFATEGSAFHRHTS